VNILECHRTIRVIESAAAAEGPKGRWPAVHGRSVPPTAAQTPAAGGMEWVGAMM